MSSSKEEFHQVMETNVDDAELPPPNASRNQIAMMYLSSEARIKELEDQLEDLRTDLRTDLRDVLREDLRTDLRDVLREDLRADLRADFREFIFIYYGAI